MRAALLAGLITAVSVGAYCAICIVLAVVIPMPWAGLVIVSISAAGIVTVVHLASRDEEGK